MLQFGNYLLDELAEGARRGLIHDIHAVDARHPANARVDRRFRWRAYDTAVVGKGTREIRHARALARVALFKETYITL